MTRIKINTIVFNNGFRLMCEDLEAVMKMKTRFGESDILDFDNPYVIIEYLLKQDGTLEYEDIVRVDTERLIFIKSKYDGFFIDFKQNV